MRATLVPEIDQLYTTSILRRACSLARQHDWLDDRVSALQLSPLGMFFYNQRAIAYASSGATLAIFLFAAWAARPLAEEFRRALVPLLVAWLTGATVTAARHGRFLADLDEWAETHPEPNQLPESFRRYLTLDSILVLTVLVWSRYGQLHLEILAIVLFANLILYTAFFGRGEGSSLRVVLAIAIAIFATLSLLPGVSLAISGRPRLFVILQNAVSLGTLSFTVFSTWMIGRLGAMQHRITQTHLNLLGEYEAALSGPTPLRPMEASRYDEAFTDDVLRERLTFVLRNLCNWKGHFWYASATIWVLETRDHATILLPIASHESPEARQYANGVPFDRGLADFPEIVLTLPHTAPSPPTSSALPLTALRDTNRCPAAFVKLSVRHKVDLGILSIYGDEKGPPVLAQYRDFLRSLGTIIANDMVHWSHTYRAGALRALDELFAVEGLDTLFPVAARLMCRYLNAQACLILMRPDPSGTALTLVAQEGVMRRLPVDTYNLDYGQTGRCARDGVPIRFDDVTTAAPPLQKDQLRTLRNALGRDVRAWLAIPIGGGGSRNLGVVKIVNKRSGCPWFRDADQRLATDLALRLQIAIERSRREQAAQQARDDAERHAAHAEVARAAAEKTALERHEDLMIITHQLQGPLAAAITAVTSLREASHHRKSARQLEYAHLLLEDALTVCFATSTSFAIDAGRQTAFGSDLISASDELAGLAQRLQLTNARDDLSFSFQQEDEFPSFAMDRELFASVFYSLIHNAMKYADPFSQVSFTCLREYGRWVVKVASMGEPIEADECERVFDKFRRGRTVGSTGRHHRGVGLGLWVARRLMRAAGGDLYLQIARRAPRLSVFVVQLPPMLDEERGS